MLLKEAQATKDVLEIPSDEEFASAFQKAYAQLDKGPKNPGDLQELRYRVSFEEFTSEVIKSMSDCLDVIELGKRYDLVVDLRILAENAIESIDGLEKYKIKVSPEVSSQMYEIQKKLKILLSTKPTDTQGIRQEIDKYNEHALAIWDDYLSQSENGENSGFRWIIHNLTHGKLEGNFKDKYMSTSLITNNAMWGYKYADTTFDGTNYINTGIQLFSEENKDKNFEISFNIDECVSAGNQDTLISAMDESGNPYPGFVFRVANGGQLEISANVTNSLKANPRYNRNATSVAIRRVDGILYASINGGAFNQVLDMNSIQPFDSNLAIGASLNGSGNPQRYFKGTLSDITLIFDD